MEKIKKHNLLKFERMYRAVNPLIDKTDYLLNIDISFKTNGNLFICEIYSYSYGESKLEFTTKTESIFKVKSVRELRVKFKEYYLRG